MPESEDTTTTARPDGPVFGERCDFCGADPEPWYVDGKTRIGPWAIMCPDCFRTDGIGLGIGRGQRYDSRTGRQLR